MRKMATNFCLEGTQRLTHSVNMFACFAHGKISLPVRRSPMLNISPVRPGEVRCVSGWVTIILLPYALGRFLSCFAFLPSLSL